MGYLTPAKVLSKVLLLKPLYGYMSVNSENSILQHTVAFQTR